MACLEKTAIIPAEADEEDEDKGPKRRRSARASKPPKMDLVVLSLSSTDRVGLLMLRLCEELPEMDGQGAKRRLHTGVCFFSSCKQEGAP